MNVAEAIEELSITQGAINALHEERQAGRVLLWRRLAELNAREDEENPTDDRRALQSERDLIWWELSR